MEVLSLLFVAWMPVLRVLFIAMLGVLLASKHCNILVPDARVYVNKVVFAVFVPSLLFTSLAEMVTLNDIISWWFMPVNIGITFALGATLGGLSVKILQPGERLKSLIIACSSAGNWGSLPLILVPAICHERGSPFGDPELCNSQGLTFVSFSFALGNIYIWTHSYYIMKRSAVVHGGIDAPDDPQESSSFVDTGLWRGGWKENTKEMMKELISPPTVSAFMGFLVGTLPKVRSMLIPRDAPLRVIVDSIKLLGKGTIPCTILILGGNLTSGVQKSAMRPTVVLAIMCIRYAVLPVCGIGIVAAADSLGFLPQSRLYHYVLLPQFTVPPALSVGTIAQLFGVGEEECSVIFLWTHAFAAPVLTFWSAVYMWILF